MKDKNENLIEFLDTVFVVDGEMKADNGEDCYAFSVNEKYGMIGVFDGCGGIGSRKYDVYENKTGAYIASRAVASSANRWFESFCDSGIDLSGNSVKDICSDIYFEFADELKSVESKTEATTIKGSLSKSFPTTVSMILFKNRNGKMYSSFIWAGDSRGFILDKYGLAQITKDDIDEDEDALSNLSNDGKLTNVVSAGGDFKLNHKVVETAEAGLMITATDGCFGYFSTPMEFEYMILSTMVMSRNVNDWKSRLNRYMLKYTGDDYTLGIVAYGFKSFRNMKKAYAERKQYMEKNYIFKMEDITEEQKKMLWEKYKKGYYRGA